FRRVNIHITNATFKYNAFQFRFLNYATLNGNRDHWNIDYVWLDYRRYENDSLEDISFVYPIKSYLNEYSSMPYSHYIHVVGTGVNPARTTDVDTARFYLVGTTNASMTFFLNDLNGPFAYSELYSP